jgi:hypothetical protein
MHAGGSTVHQHVQACCSDPCKPLGRRNWRAHHRVSESPFEEGTGSRVPVNRPMGRRLFLDAFKSHLDHSYLSPFTSLSRVTLEPNFILDDIIPSLSSDHGFTKGFP